MNQKLEIQVEMDDQGRLVLPSEVVSRYKLKPGARICLEDNGNGLRLQSKFSTPAKVYVEPTNRCNLECRTCMRNVWEESAGEMSGSTFARIIDGLQAVSPVPRVFLGGLGEPLVHPNIIEMVAQAKGLGGPVELITNGTLLSRDMSRRLLDAGLDMLWISLDGATPESYADVRLGAALPEVLANIAAFRDALRREYPKKAQIGIAFVVMKRNIGELPKVLRLTKELGARELLVSNLLPFTREMREEILYTRTATDFPYDTYLKLPLLDVNEITREPLYQALRGGQTMNFSWTLWGNAGARCPFIENSTTTIDWQGDLSPCLPLMHNHVSFFDNRERFSRRYVLGNVNEVKLQELWNASEYIAFRERVQSFDFSPCTICGGCDFGEGNEEDCFGNSFPTCGGCLWAKGVLQCP